MSSIKINANTKLNQVNRKIISSLLVNNYDLLSTVYARIYTCDNNTKTWFFSGLEGALTLVIDYHRKAGRGFFFLNKKKKKKIKK
jgi:hypothetical protein